jgi:hypothetical protein
MAESWLDGRVIDGIIALVAVEAVALTALKLFWRRGPASASFVANLLSGGFLLVALKNALAGGSSTILGLCLAAALVAHLVDLFARWKTPAGAAPRRPSSGNFSLCASITRVRGAYRAPKDERPDA